MKHGKAFGLGNGTWFTLSSNEEKCLRERRSLSVAVDETEDRGHASPP